MVTKADRDQLKRIKENVSISVKTNKENCQRFKAFREYLFSSTLDGDKRALLEGLGKPILEANITEAYISRLLGEYSKQEPSLYVSSHEESNIPEQVTRALEDYIRCIMFDSNDDENTDYEVYKDCLSGGFSAIKVWTEYLHPSSFQQVIKYGRPKSPTLCGFDPLAKLPHKGDGQYCYDIFPMYDDEIKQKYGIDVSKIKYNTSTIFNEEQGQFNWFYTLKNGKKICVLCEYYEKEYKETRLVELADGRKMFKDDYLKALESWQEISQPPAIIDERKTHKVSIVRYLLIGDQIIEKEKTIFNELPIIFVDGNSVDIEDLNTGTCMRMTRPYHFNAKGTQDFVNLSIINYANWIENIVQSKWTMPVSAIPKGKETPYLNNQIGGILFYNQFDPLNPEMRLDKPEMVVQQQMPPEIANGVTVSLNLLQNILGTYDASLGINNNQLSGVAIVEAASQSNPVAMPYIVGQLSAKTQLGKILVDIIPKIQKSEMTITAMNNENKKYQLPINGQNSISFNYPDNSFKVKVEAGVNFAIQKNKALTQIAQLSQSNPTMAQFFGDPQGGLPIVLRNVEIYGADNLEKAVDQWEKAVQQRQAQQAQAQAQNNPMAMKAQLEQQKFMHQVQQDQQDNQFRAAEVANDAHANQNESVKIMMEAKQSNMDSAIQADKANAERYAKSVDLALSSQDQQHKHAKEVIETLHNVNMDHENLAHQKQVLTSQQNRGNFG